jgi:hypothetical protein
MKAKTDITVSLIHNKCGGLSCDQCNDEREAAAEEIVLLRREIERLKIILRETAETLMIEAQ